MAKIANCVCPLNQQLFALKTRYQQRLHNVRDDEHIEATKSNIFDSIVVTDNRTTSISKTCWLGFNNQRLLCRPDIQPLNLIVKAIVLLFSTQYRGPLSTKSILFHEQAPSCYVHKYQQRNECVRADSPHRSVQGWLLYSPFR